MLVGGFRDYIVFRIQKQPRMFYITSVCFYETWYSFITERYINSHDAQSRCTRLANAKRAECNWLYAFELFPLSKKMAWYNFHRTKKS